MRAPPEGVGCAVRLPLVVSQAVRRVDALAGVLLAALLGKPLVHGCQGHASACWRRWLDSEAAHLAQHVQLRCAVLLCVEGSSLLRPRQQLLVSRRLQGRKALGGVLPRQLREQASQQCRRPRTCRQARSSARASQAMRTTATTVDGWRRRRQRLAQPLDCRCSPRRRGGGSRALPCCSRRCCTARCSPPLQPHPAGLR
jgi:hypothetical protein